MKKKVFALVAGLLVGSFLLSGCSQAKEANIESETSAGYSSILEDNGYYTGVKALDIVQLPEDYADVTIPAEYLAVSDDTVDGYIKDMMANFDMTQPVTDRAAQEGDVATIDYVGTIDGVEFEGGSATDYKVELGSGTLIGDFEEQIIGQMPGAEFDVTISFPEGYGETQDAQGNTIELSNKTAVFSVTLKNLAVYELTDEAVAAAFGTSYTLDDGSVVATVEDARQYFTEYARYKAATTYLADYFMTNSTAPPSWTLTNSTDSSTKSCDKQVAELTDFISVIHLLSTDIASENLLLRCTVSSKRRDSSANCSS